MAKIVHTYICVIGGGSGKRTVAAGAMQIGAKTAPIEPSKMGGDF